MSDIVLVALIGSIPGSLAAFGTIAIGVLQLRTHAQVSEIEKNTNGINAALVKVTGESELAKGKLEGAETQKLKDARKHKN